MNEKAALFESGSYRRAVIRQIAPAIAANMISLVYNLADTWFVGLLNAPRQTAAVTVVYPWFIMLTAVSNLFGVGGAACAARALGRKSPGDAKEISAVSFWCGLAFSAVFVVLFALLMRPALTVCGATEETYGYCFSYALYSVVMGGVFSSVSMLLANLVRSQGESFAASLGVSLGGVLNMALDPFFILPRFLNMGVGGAGLATAISNVFSVAFFLIYIKVKRGGISLDPRLVKKGLRHVGSILRIGFPSAVQYALTVVAIAAQARFVSKYPTEALAAVGIIKKLDNLPINFSIGAATGLLPLLAYNHAAGNGERFKKSFRFGVSIALGFALICLAVYEVFAPQLAYFFIKDAATVSYAAAFLRRMVVAMPLMSVCYAMIIRFQAMGRARESLIVSILRKGVIDIPLLFLMDAVQPLYGLMWVQPIVDFIALSSAFILAKRIAKRTNHTK